MILPMQIAQISSGKVKPLAESERYTQASEQDYTTVGGNRLCES